MIVRVTTVAGRFDENGRHAGPGRWLDLIHEANRLAPDTFGVPLSMGKVGDDFVEHYAAADVVMSPSGDVHGLVTITTKTAEASRLITEAATNLSLSTEEV